MMIAISLLLQFLVELGLMTTSPLVYSSKWRKSGSLTSVSTEPHILDRRLHEGGWALVYNTGLHYLIDFCFKNPSAIVKRDVLHYSCPTPNPQIGGT